MTESLYKLRRAAIFAVLGSCFLLINPAHSHAASGLMLIPPVIDEEVNPGSEITGELELSNPTEELITVYPSVMEFKAKGETGEPDFDFGASVRNSGVTTWIEYDPAMLALEKNQNTKFSYKISVPANASPGGHYATIFFSTQPPSSDPDATQVNIVSKIGSLVLLRVPGDVEENISVKEFSALTKIFQQKASLSVRLQNSGNIHAQPKGEITITNLGGKKMASINVNPEGGNVLPDTIRKFDVDWDAGNLAIGRYKAELAMVYGNRNSPLSAVTYFWIIPWWSILILIAIVITVFALIKRNKHRRRYSRYS